MVFAGIKKPQERGDLIAYLEQASKQINMYEMQKIIEELNKMKRPNW